jgi:hypothetical protein
MKKINFSNSPKNIVFLKMVAVYGLHFFSKANTMNTQSQINKN